MKTKETLVSAVTCLDDLSLSADDMAELAHQGFVCRESRGATRTCYKLRFRSSGKQTIRFLGHDANLAKLIESEVLELQSLHRLEQELKRVTAEARQLLRQTKQHMNGVVAAVGLKFHGYALRRSVELLPAALRSRPEDLQGEILYNQLNSTQEECAMETQDGVNGSGCTDASEPMPCARSDRFPGALKDVHLAKIEEYLRASLQNPNLLQATLGAATGNLMRMGLRLEGILDAYLANQPDAFERLERVLPSIETNLRIMRQIDRFARLGHELERGGHKSLPEQN